MRRFIIAVTFVLAITQHTDARQCGTFDENSRIGESFYTGSSLNQMSDRDLTIYITGFADAFSTSMLVGTTRECYDRIQSCTDGRTNTQFAAMVRKYLRENPANWHHAANVIVYNAIFARCLK